MFEVAGASRSCVQPRCPHYMKERVARGSETAAAARVGAREIGAGGEGRRRWRDPRGCRCGCGRWTRRGGARARESLDESTNEDKDKTERKETQENKVNVKT